MNEELEYTYDNIRPWVAHNLPNLARQFGVGHWRLDIFYDQLSSSDESTTLMTCNASSSYEQASITIDREACIRRLDSWQEFNGHFEHELLHVVLSSIQDFVRDVIGQLPEGAIEFAQRRRDNALESTVRDVERLVFSLRKHERPDPELEPFDLSAGGNL